MLGFIMCKYEHSVENQVSCPCQLQNYFSLCDKNETLPLDETGLCIFHSSNIEWKINNHFTAFCNKLFEIINLIDKNIIEYEPPNGFLDFDLRGIHWIGEKQSDNNECVINIKNIIFEKYVSLFMHGGFFHNELIVKDINASHSTLDFRNSTFNELVTLVSLNLKDISMDSCQINKGLDMGKCEIMEFSEFYRMQVKGDFIIFGSTFSGDIKFLQSIFDTKYWNLDHVNFNNSVDFCKCVFNQEVVIENCTFAEELLFIDSVFNKEVRMYLNEYEGNVSFSSNDPANKIFNDIVYINVKKKELKGLISFENVNFMNIAQRDRDNLNKLARSNKVRIGKGCIKYRVQSPTISVKTDSVNHNLFTELTTSFSNYFLHSNGFSLGVEFVDKQIHKLELFYFTDEDISKEEFISRLKLTESRYWNFSIDKNELTDKSKSLHIIDDYVSKLGILSKIAIRKQFGLWSDIETEELLKSISLNENSIGTEYINLTIEALNINIQPKKMEIKQINVSQGGQVNIAERIGKIEFNPTINSLVSENDFNSLKTLLLKLEPDDLSDLEQNIKSLQSENIESDRLNTLEEKINNYLIKHGLPIVHSLTATGIFELLKAFIG